MTMMTPYGVTGWERDIKARLDTTAVGSYCTMLDPTVFLLDLFQRALCRFPTPCACP